MINRMEIKSKMGVERPDPEVQAGRALRRLRLSRGWSQEEVARRMQAFGYDFHQTMIAKIEAAQRPLRVRELADFAALYDVEVQELIYPPSGSLEEAAQEIQELEAQREKVREQARALESRLSEIHSALIATESEYGSSSRELAVLDERLDFLRHEAGRFRSITEQAAAIDEEIRRRGSKGASYKD